MTNRFFKVKDAAGKSHFFDLKGVAKKFRDGLIEKGFKVARVSPGPDHPNHITLRRAVGWNKGKHPKRKAVNRATQKALSR